MGFRGSGFRVNGFRVAVLVAAMAAPVLAQDPTGTLASSSLLGFQTLVDGPPSRSGFPPDARCPDIRRHVPGQPWNDWTKDNLPEGCRDVLPKVDDNDTRSHFELRAYLDVGTVGWDSVYESLIPSIGGFHVSFADFGGWKLGAGGLLASFSPVFDVQSNRQRYQLSPRLNVININRQVTSLTAKYELYFSLAATRELFLPYGAEAVTSGAHQFNNVFGGVSVSTKRK